MAKRRKRLRTLFVDADLRNADWSKRGTWDHTELPRNERELEAWLKRTYIGTDMTLERFKRMPAYEGWLAAIAPKPPPET